MGNDFNGFLILQEYTCRDYKRTAHSHATVDDDYIGVFRKGLNQFFRLATFGRDRSVGNGDVDKPAVAD